MELYHVFASKGKKGLDEVSLIAGNDNGIIVGILDLIAGDVGVGTIVERHAIFNAYRAENRARGHSMMILLVFISFWLIIGCY